MERKPTRALFAALILLWAIVAVVVLELMVRRSETTNKPDIQANDNITSEMPLPLRLMR
jgi:hypothetical protein